VRGGGERPRPAALRLSGVSSAVNEVITSDAGGRMERARRALTVTRVARRTGLRRVLAEIGLVGHREATREELEQGALKIGFVPTGLGEL
jgi:hypothetical protein